MTAGRKEGVKCVGSRESLFRDGQLGTEVWVTYLNAQTSLGKGLHYGLETGRWTRWPNWGLMHWKSRGHRLERNVLREVIWSRTLEKMSEGSDILADRCPPELHVSSLECEEA